MGPTHHISEEAAEGGRRGGHCLVERLPQWQLLGLIYIMSCILGAALGHRPLCEHPNLQVRKQSPKVTQKILLQLGLN